MSIFMISEKNVLYSGSKTLFLIEYIKILCWRNNKKFLKKRSLLLNVDQAIVHKRAFSLEI